jgi:hypothetical protein
MTSALNKQPVSIAIEADQSSFQLYKSGVLTGKCGTNLDHGVLAVGYGTSGSSAFYKVKNSWGKTWGESGYIRLTKGISQKGGQCCMLLSEGGDGGDGGGGGGGGGDGSGGGGADGTLGSTMAHSLSYSCHGKGPSDGEAGRLKTKARDLETEDTRISDSESS